MGAGSSGWHAIWGALPILLSTAVAQAHPEPLFAGTVVFDPVNPRHAVMESAAYGLFETQDGGATFSYLCGANDVVRDGLSPVAILQGGRIVIAGQFNGLRMASPGACDFAPHPEFGNQPVFDVVTTRHGSVFYVLGGVVEDASNAVSSTFVARSLDGARSFDRLGPMPAGTIAYRLAVAASDDRRMYALGGEGTSTNWMLRSMNGGASWDKLPVPPVPSEVYLNDIVVSPADPDLVFLVAAVTSETDSPALWVSFDGAASYQVVFSGNSSGALFSLNYPVAGRVFSPDGSEFVFGGPNGLWHVEVAALRRNVTSIEKYSERKFYSMTWTSEGLYAGGSDYHFEPELDFMLGVSHDSGRTFSRLSRTCDLVVGCGGNAPACEPLATVLRENIIESIRCTAVDSGIPLASGDGGKPQSQHDVGAQRITTYGGCGCRLSRSADERVGFVWLALALTARSRSKRPRARCSSCRSARNRESSPSRRC